MLDIRLIRSEPDFVKARLETRGAVLSLVDAVLEADEKLRAYKSYLGVLQANRNSLSKEIPQLMKAGRRDEAEAAKGESREAGEQIAKIEEQERAQQSLVDDLLFRIPNLPHETTPAGGEEDNVILRTHGAPREFTDFAPKPHWELAASLNLIDFVRGAKMSGSGFVLYRGLGALLERGLIQFMLDLHIKKHGYTEWSTPFFLNRDSMKASTHLVKFTPEMYHDAESDLFALPTAEPALVNIHRDEILDGASLPLKYVAYSPCWRREAGAAGKDTRGLLRIHQFDKVEMVKYTLPETSYDELESLVTNATDVLDALGLPYRIKLLAGGDISFAAAKCYDIEIYAPGAGQWLEVSSCSNCEDFQSRQGNIRFRREPGAKPEFPHLLNGSGVALPRLIAALLETYQQVDGSVAVPEALRPCLGGRETLTAED